MKAVILNGARPVDRDMDQIQEALTAEFKSGGWEVDPILLHTVIIAPCMGCFGCWTKTPGLCVIKDSGNDIAGKIINSDLVVILTPVTFGGYSSELKKILDRISCPIASPFFTKVHGEVHHQRRYDRYPHLLALGTLPEADPESEGIFTTLVERNSISMNSASHGAHVLVTGRSEELIKADVAEAVAGLEVVQ